MGSTIGNGVPSVTFGSAPSYGYYPGYVTNYGPRFTYGNAYQGNRSMSGWGGYRSGFSRRYRSGSYRYR